MQQLKHLLFCLLIPSTSAFANSQTEINHLLNFIATTKCQYERNGKIHTGEEALAHIQKKYKYYFDDIHSAEDFISYSATKSTISGRHYQIHCPGLASLNSQDWLLLELKRYRAEIK